MHLIIYATNKRRACSIVSDHCKNSDHKIKAEYELKNKKNIVVESQKKNPAIAIEPQKGNMTVTQSNAKEINSCNKFPIKKQCFSFHLN